MHKRQFFCWIFSNFQKKRNCAWRPRSKNVQSMFKTLIEIVSVNFWKVFSMFGYKRSHSPNPDENLSPLRHKKLAGILSLVPTNCPVCPRMNLIWPVEENLCNQKPAQTNRPVWPGTQPFSHICLFYHLRAKMARTVPLIMADHLSPKVMVCYFMYMVEDL